MYLKQERGGICRVITVSAVLAKVGYDLNRIKVEAEVEEKRMKHEMDLEERRREHEERMEERRRAEELCFEDRCIA